MVLVLKKKQAKVLTTVAYAWGMGGVGVNPPLLLKILKEMKTSFFGTNRPFLYRDCRNFSHVLLCYPTCNKILRNFHCDAILGLPVIKVFWCAALDVDNIAEKAKPFFFETNRLFFVRSLPKLLSCFSVRSNFLI